MKKKTKSLTRIYNHEKLVENEDDSKPEEDKSIPGNKLFGADEEAPATLKKMPLWLTWHLEFVCHILIENNAFKILQTIEVYNNGNFSNVIN